MIASAIARHQRIALQFSGGRDSLACLFLLREFWDRLTVYHLDSGDQFPETADLVRAIGAIVPRMVVVQGRAKEVRAELGWATDVISVFSTAFGRKLAGDKGIPLLDRYTCCYRSIMEPMHQRMLADGVTLIIRGQKASDAQKSPILSGQTVDGIEFLFPIEDWTTEDVTAFLEGEGIPIPRFYEKHSSSMDCIGCTAWLEEGRGTYLKEHHPEAFATYQHRLRLIGAELSPCIDLLNREASL